MPDVVLKPSLRPQKLGVGNKKGQPRWLAFCVVVEAAGIEPASASPTPSVLHA